MRKVGFHHPREWMIGMHFLSLFLADISRSKSRGMKLRGLDRGAGSKCSLTLALNVKAINRHAVWIDLIVRGVSWC